MVCDAAGNSLFPHSEMRTDIIATRCCTSQSHLSHFHVTVFTITFYFDLHSMVIYIYIPAAVDLQCKISVEFWIGFISLIHQINTRQE
jgi:hypothetical protein